MKKDVKEKEKEKYDIFNKTLIKSLPFKLLILLVIILAGLIIAFVILQMMGNEPIIKSGVKAYYSEMGLGSMGLYGDEQIMDEVYAVIPSSYSLNAQNTSIFLSLTRPAGLNINKIIVTINKTLEYGGDCNYNITSGFPNDLETKIYEIVITNTNCGINFTGTYAVSALANLTIATVNLAQTQIIPNLQIYQNQYKSNVINLSSYFTYLAPGDNNLAYSYLISQQKVEIKNSSDFVNTRMLHLNASNDTGVYNTNITLSYPGLTNVISNNFNIAVVADICSDTDFGMNYTVKGTTRNSTNNGTDDCWNSTYIREYYCVNTTAIDSGIISCKQVVSEYYICSDGACILNSSQNRTPIFIYNSCDTSLFTWYNNQSLSVNIANCFSDPDNDALTYRYSNSDSNINISLSSSTLTITPKTNWTGSGVFNIYANDSLHETMATISFQVNQAAPRIIPLVIPPVVVNRSIEIKNPLPNKTDINESYGINLSFGIGNNISLLDSVRWYLDKNLTATNTATILLSRLSPGSHTLEVEIKKGNYTKTYSWNINIFEEKPYNPFFFDSGKVILYLIFVVVVMVIILVVWLFVQENQRKNKKIGLDLSSLDKKDNVTSNQMSGNFNLPR